jgi:hypothetical protein
VVKTVSQATSYVDVISDVKVTTCTSPYGSREGNGPQMCKGHVNRAGTKVRVKVFAMQMADNGGYCNSKTLSSRTAHVDKMLHHAMFQQAGRYVLTRANGCTSTVRIKAQVTDLNGSDLIVHTGGTLNTIYR